MGNTVPPREATGTGRRRSENFVTEAAAPPATPRKQGRERDDDEQAGEGRPRAGGADGAAPAPAGKVLTVRIVMTRKDAEALVARLRARSARERKARMAELKGELRAGTCCSAEPTLPPIKGEEV